MTFAAFEAPGISGFVHRPDHPAGRGLVLTHGAGSNCRAPLLVAVADAFVAAGVTVLRCDLAFRQRRPSGPPAPAMAARDREGLRLAVEALAASAPRGVMLVGHSYGGRQASLLAAEAPGLAAALVLLSYPLHPPSKPTERRTAHFPGIAAPALFVHGSNDPFGSIAELEAAAALIPAKTRILAVAGAGHDLKRGRFDLAGMVAAATDLFG